MRLLLFVVTFLIVYGSLFPFAVDTSSYHPQLLKSLFYFGLDKTGRGDLIANILLFAPFGFLSMLAVSGPPAGWRLLVVLSTAFLLAFALQAGQLFIPGRTPVGSDVTANILGCAIGCAFALTPLGRYFEKQRASTGGARIPTILALLWLLQDLAPFVPSVDLQLLKDNLKAIATQSPDLVWTFQSTTMWLVVFHFLKTSSSRLLAEKNYIAIVIVVLTASFMILGNVVSLNKILGALLALPTWFLVRRCRRAGLLALLVAVAILAINFTPFELRHEPAEFRWVPFAGALSGNLFINVLAIAKKLVLYGALIWLLTECSFRLRGATFATAAFLLTNEYLQVFFVRSTPEVTDALLALGLGIAFQQYLRRTAASVPAATSRLLRDGGFVGKGVADKQADLPRSPGRPSSNYLPGMEGLRAVAALSVFLVHFNQKVPLHGELGPFDLNRLLVNGNTGVALFFVLSGLLLSIPFWRAQMERTPFPALNAYAWRRAGRIIPAYYLCLFTILFAKSMAGSNASWNNILSHLLFVYNTNEYNILALNQPFWTLAVEAQFYLFLPLLFLGLRAVRARTATVAVFLLIPGFYFLNDWIVDAVVNHATFPIKQTLLWPFSLYISGPKSAVLIYSTLAHLPHFLLGVLSARFFLLLLTSKFNDWPFRKLFDGVALLAGSLLLFILSTPLDDVLQIPNGRYNFPFVPILLSILLVSVPFSRYAQGLLCLRVVAWMGTISYGIYLFHYPVLKVVTRVMGWAGFPVSDHGLILFLISLFATLLCSQISYVVLEAPVMAWIKAHVTARKTSRTASAFDSDTAAAGDESRTATTNNENSVRPPSRSDTSPIWSGVEGGREFQLNLHDYQSDFLDALARAAGLEVSQVLAAIILGSADFGDERLRRMLREHPQYQNGELGVSREGWVQLNVTLDPDSWASLLMLAGQSNESPSACARHLLQNYMDRLRGTPLRDGHSPSSGKRTRGQSLRLLSIAGIAAIALWVGTHFFHTTKTRVADLLTAPVSRWGHRNLTMQYHKLTSFDVDINTPSALLKSCIQTNCGQLALITQFVRSEAEQAASFERIDSLRRQNPDVLLLSGIEVGESRFPGFGSGGLLIEPAGEKELLRVLSAGPEYTAGVTQRDIPRGSLEAEAGGLVRGLRKKGIRFVAIDTSASTDSGANGRGARYLARLQERATSFDIIEREPRALRHDGVAIKSSAGAAHLRPEGFGAEVGGDWDAMLDLGHDIWGLIACSPNAQAEPAAHACNGTRVHLSAVERTYSSMITALGLGAFWSQYGKFLERFDFGLEFEGLRRPATPGSVVGLGAQGDTAVISIALARGEQGLGLPITVDVISNCHSGRSQVVYTADLDPEANVSTGLVAVTHRGSDGVSCYLRARARTMIPGQPRFIAITNPVRVRF